MIRRLRNDLQPKSASNIAQENTDCGILLHNTSNTTVANNDASYNGGGILLVQGSRKNLVINNIGSNNSRWGIDLSHISTDNNQIFSNTANWNNLSGINLNFSNGNEIKENTIIKNGENGISLDNSRNNSIYHNNLINNTNQAFDNIKANVWDSGYPSGGNYWSDYNGNDNFHGPYQNQSGKDGIGDIPYTNIGGGAADRYPFMNETGWVEHMDSPPVAICGPDKLRCENVGAPVYFNASLSYDPDGAIVSYYWDFGDGSNNTGRSPAHIYRSYKWNGSAYLPFIVNLTVIDSKGYSNETSQKVVVWIAGDANGDGKANILDASVVGLKWGSSDPCADLNNDGIVDQNDSIPKPIVNILDASIIGLNWGKTAIINS